MNKLLYRIIFNKSRGMLMVVADIARSGQGGGGRSSRPGTLLPHQWARLSPLGFALLTALGCVSIVAPAQAGIVADAGAPANQQPVIVNTANGVPQVNIQTPSAGGVSRNTYSQFDVDGKGAILNNSRERIQTQQGGWVERNPYLAQGEAKVILNEVNSSNPSRLGGYVEVAGTRAQVIIANPAGITCDGCGFINANRATLTTGRAQMQDGNLTGYDVRQGEIIIQGGGLDSRTQDYTDIIARSVKVNAGIWANDLRVTTGNNQVSAAHDNIQATRDGSASPQLALDASQLGGMYAGKIRLIGTEKGVGVRNAGNIGASAGSVTLTADGRIENSGTINASQDIQLTSTQDISNQGKVYASGETSVTAGGQLGNSGVIAAASHTRIKGGTINNSQSGAIAGGMSADGTLSGSGTLTLDADGNLTGSGKHLAAGQLTVTGSDVDLGGSQTYGKQVAITARQGSVSVSGANIQSDTLLSLNAPVSINNDGGILQADTLNLSTDRLSNRKGNLIQTGSQSLTLNHRGGIDNRGGQITSNGQDLTLQTQQLNNQQGSIQHVGAGHFTLTADQLDNRQGTLSTVSGDALITSQQQLLNDGGKLGAGKRLQIQANGMSNTAGLVRANVLDVDLQQGGLINTQGTLLSQGAFTLNSGDVNNRNGLLVSGADAALTLGALDNQGGRIGATGTLTMDTLQVQNDTGLIQSGGLLSLNTNGQSLSNGASGSQGGITSQSDIQLRTGVFSNLGGTVIANRNLTLNSGSLNNQQGQLAALGALQASTADVSNQGGKIQAGTSLSWDTRPLRSAARQFMTLLAAAPAANNVILNAGGQIQSGGDLTLAGSSLDNSQGGSIITNGNLTVTADGGISNQSGTLQAVGNLTLDAVQAVIDNTLGLIHAGQQATLLAGSVLNQGTRNQNGILGNNVSVTAGQLQNGNGAITASRDLALTLSGALDNSNGMLSSQGSSEIQADTLLNTNGDIQAQQQLTLTANQLSGDGRLLSLGNMQVSLTQDFINTGSVRASNALTFQTNGLLRNAALMQAGSTLQLGAANLENLNGAEISATTTRLSAGQTLTNYGLVDGSNTLLTASTINNLSTGRLFGDALALQAGTINNLNQNGVAPVIAARQRLDLGMWALNNNEHALIYSSGAMAIGGALDSQNQATGQGGVINNGSATIEAAGDMVLNVGTLNNTNNHFATAIVPVSDEQVQQYRMAGSTTMYTPDQISIGHGEVDSLDTPDGSNEEFTRYDFTRHIEESRIIQSDPGQILSGGNLLITSGMVLNDKSRIIAGSGLGINAGQLNNVEVPGERHITENGTATSFWRIRHKGRDEQGQDSAAYTPPEQIQSITLQPGAIQSFTAAASNRGLQGRSDSSVNGSVAGATGVNAAVLQALPNQPVIVPSGQVFEVTSGTAPESGKPAAIIRLVGPDIRLPDNSLFHTNPDRNASYLVETDPRFTNQKTWLSSDYMLSALTGDPTSVHKRLGDGFYEQRLVREQIVSLTGQRYLNGYSNDDTQFKALMDAGIAFGKQYGLTPGVALTAEQMRLLTSDMVWMVNQTVTLPDGTTQTVLVPQVYARLKEGDLDGSGALLAGRTADIRVDGDINNSGRIQAAGNATLLAENLNNTGGLIHANDLALQARTDITSIGGLISGNDSLTAQAGRDITLTTTTRSATSADGNFSRTALDRVAGLYVQNDAGKLVLQAGRDVNLTAAQLTNGGENGTTTVAAGRDINLKTVTTASRDNIVWNGDNRVTQSASHEQGSEVNAKGDIHMSAGRDLTATAASMSAGNGLMLAAGNNLTIQQGTDTATLDERHKTTGSNGFASKITTVRQDTVDRQTAAASVLSGNTVALAAGHDLTVSGSDVAGTGDVSLSAGNNLTVTAAQERDAQTHLREETHSGLMGSGGIGFTIGSNSQKTTTAESAQQHRGSTVGSSTGSLTLNAGGSLGVAGSELIAGEDVTLKGRDVSVVSLENRQDRKETREQKQSGLTIALSGSVGGALNTAVETAQSSRETQDGRVKALQQTKAALSVAQGVQAARLAQAQSEGAGGQQGGQTVGVSVSYGSQSSKSVQEQTQTTAQGSSVTAGRTLSVTATDGDVTVAGSTLKAGQDLLLDASRDIRLLSSANTQHTEGSNQSQGGSIGVSLGVSASGSFGLSVSASVNAAKGSQHGDGVTQTEALLEAGRAAVLHSGRDTTLQGAQVSAETIKAQVGRDLLVRSEQDSDHYDSKQQSMSAGVTIPIYGGGGGASFSFSRDRVNSNFESVQEQSGLFAGRGGFDVTVGNHTQLDGGAIASTAAAEKNRLDTGTLGFSNIDNHAEYSASHSGGGFGTGGPIGMQMLSNLGGLALAGANQSGSSSGTTYAAVSDGTLIIRDRTGQQQDVSGLSRDTAGANSGSLNPIFDKEKVESKLQQAQLMSDIGAQALDIASTEGAIAATKAANDKVAAASAAERRAKGSELAQASPNKAITQDDITQALYQSYYDEAMRTSPYGTGGAVRQGIQAVTAALQGVLAGNMAQALTGAAAPYMAEAIHRATTDAAGNTDVAANTLAHALLGAVVAQASGNNALAGAAGEAGGELAAHTLIEALYPGKKPSELNEEQKQYISTLATIAGGLAAGVVGNTGADAVQGAQSAQVAIENNALNSQDEKKRQDAKWSLPYLEGEKKVQAEKLIDNLNAKSDAFDTAIDAACKNLTSAQCQGMRQQLAAMGKSYDEQLDGQYIGTMRSVYKDGAKEVDDLMWQYATADAKAEREANVNRLAENWDISKEAADTLYTAMAGIHTTAAIAGAAYGMKGFNEPATVNPAGNISAFDANEIRFSTKAGAGGNWNVLDEIADPNVVKQSTPTGCGGACGEMLLKDRNIFVDQTQIGTGLKSPEQLARDLTKNAGSSWSGGFVGVEAYDALNKTGSWSAMMWDQGSKIGHWVVVKGTDSKGNVSIYDPWKGTSYKMTDKEFKGTWNGNAVFNQ
ncbi:filamentous hemagglutinin [Erwinia sp. AG740]|nr:filamentous hemagglutinin [Erwinia sp. AG740]